MTRNMGLERSSMLMETNMKVIGEMVRDGNTESMSTQTVMSMMENGGTI